MFCIKRERKVKGERQMEAERKRQKKDDGKWLKGK
jgi:hypothetical protein